MKPERGTLITDVTLNAECGHTIRCRVLCVHCGVARTN
jgi:hypothetical protein